MSPPLPAATAGVVLAVALVAYSLVTNLLLGDAGYVWRNLVAAALLVALAHSLGVDWDGLGLAAADLARGWRWGNLVVVGAAVAVAAIGALAGTSETVARLLADRRADLPPGQLVYQTLVRIPLGTAVFEEVAFRGVLLGVLLRATSVPVAVAVSSVAFGLWHVAPTLETLRLNEAVARFGPIAGAVGLTGIAGVGLCWLRLASGSLLAPMLAHWAVNALFLLTAAVFHRTASTG